MVAPLQYEVTRSLVKIPRNCGVDSNNRTTLINLANISTMAATVPISSTLPPALTSSNRPRSTLPTALTSSNRPRETQPPRLQKIITAAVATAILLLNHHMLVDRKKNLYRQLTLAKEKEKELTRRQRLLYQYYYLRSLNNNYLYKVKRLK